MQRSDNKWQQMTTSETNDNEWQRMTTSDNEWQQVTTSDTKIYNKWQQLKTSGTIKKRMKPNEKYAIYDFNIFRNIDYLYIKYLSSSNSWSEKVFVTN